MADADTEVKAEGEAGADTAAAAPAELSYGEKAVGLTFNPSGDPDVLKVKQLYAEIINICNDKRSAEAGPTEKGRLFAVAITEAQTAQMWAVKGITFAS